MAFSLKDGFLPGRIFQTEVEFRTQSLLAPTPGRGTAHTFESYPLVRAQYVRL